jgi:hypothetical protein
MERLRVAWLERLPLGTRYREVVQRVREVTSLPEFAGSEVVADATGVGMPVVEMLQDEGWRLALCR